MDGSFEIPKIVSVDDHVVEPSHLWQTWLPSALRERGPRVVRSALAPPKAKGDFFAELASEGPEVDVWIYEDLVAPILQVIASAGVPPDQITANPVGYDQMRPGCFEPKARLADMDLNHTEASLCFPTIPRFCGQIFLEATDKDLAAACVRAYNDWMIEEWCGDSGGRLIPLCLVPLWDPALAAEEVRRNAARGCRAVCFTELPANLNLPSLYTNHWDPLFRACDETGTVICMHIGSGSKMTKTSPDCPAAVMVVLTFDNAQLSMTDWLVSGALARFPNLKIAYSEAQLGWMPFLLQRIDDAFTHSRAWGDFPESVTELPSTYAAGRVFGCFFRDSFGLASRDLIGIDQITFEVDYPHQDSTWPNTLDVVESFPTMTDTELRKVLRENAIRLFDLDLG